MTVNISQIQYIITANDIAKTRFDFPFVIYDKNDIATVLNDDTVPPIFTVTLNNNKNGGYVDFPTPFAVGTVVTLYRKMAYNRKTVFQNNQDVTASALNTEFNNILALAQQNAQHNEKTLRMAASENSGNFVLPRRNDRKNTVLCFDSNGMVQLHKNQYSAVTESEKSAQQAKRFETLSKQNYVATQKLKMDILTIVNQQNAQMGLKADKVYTDTELAKKADKSQTLSINGKNGAGNLISDANTKLIRQAIDVNPKQVGSAVLSTKLPYSSYYYGGSTTLTPTEARYSVTSAVGTDGLYIINLGGYFTGNASYNVVIRVNNAYVDNTLPWIKQSSTNHMDNGHFSRSVLLRLQSTDTVSVWVSLNGTFTKVGALKLVTQVFKIGD